MNSGYATQILGAWQMNSVNFIRNGQAYNALAEYPGMTDYIGAIYTFYDNYSVAINCESFRETTNYSIDGISFYLAEDGYGIGEITYIDDNQLQVIIPISSGFYTEYFQFNLSRY